VLHVTRSVRDAVLTFIAAAAIGLACAISSAAPAAASTAGEMTDGQDPRPKPLIALIQPMSLGLRVIDAIAGGIASVVELVATPDPIAIPAPAAEGS
jgi:hypothetical protein